MSFNFAPVINDPRAQDSTESVNGNRSLPTNDVDVRVELRKLNQPVALSGEGNRERRARLEALLNEQNITQTGSEDVESSEESDEEFYTPGRPELVGIRKGILEESIKKAHHRVSLQKALASSLNFTKMLKHRRQIAATLGRYELLGAYTMRGNQRMLSRVRYNSTQAQLACSSWEGTFGIFMKDASGFYRETHRSAPGYHSEMATLAWSPKNEHLLVSGGAEGKVNIWDTTAAATGQDPVELSPTASNVDAHSKRIAQMAFHPEGALFATTSYDQTWKLWDVARPEQELLEQEGHSKEVYSLAFHPDGGLLATGGLDAIGLLWDLRSGRKIASFESHVKAIYSMDFSPNGNHLATGSGDNSVKIWDLRKGRGAELFSIPAHTRIVSDVRFLQGNLETQSGLSAPVTDENDASPEALPISGTCLVTSSYDNTVKVWSADNWVKTKTLVGHTDRVSSCDIRSDGQEIVSCGWDRTLRTWGLEDNLLK